VAGPISVKRGVVVIDMTKLSQLVEAFGKKVHRTIKQALSVSIDVMIRDIVINRLEGQYLNRVTGTLIRSITASKSAEVSGDLILAKYGSNLPYAKIHEEGFVGRIHVRGFSRTMTPQVTSKKKARLTKRRLKKKGGGLRKRVHYVKPHTRLVDFAARYFFRDTLRDNFPATQDRVVHALFLLAKKGTVPKMAELR
jgi:hypothetical protein